MVVVEGAVSSVLYAGLGLVNGLGPDSSAEPVLGISAPVDRELWELRVYLFEGGGEIILRTLFSGRLYFRICKGETKRKL